jgi:riboflavin kinase
MKTVLLAALKWLALRGAVRRPVHVSSGQLAKELDVTQQSGARYLLELADRGLLERRLVRGGQMVRLLQPARDLLRREFADYSLIFDAQPEITLTGVLETGLGEGGYYISRNGYTTQFEALLGWTPYEGTLNLRIGEAGVPELEAIRAADGKLVEGFSEAERTFGRVWLFPASISSNNQSESQCALITPKRTHYRRVIELISPHYLRDLLSATDGQELQVTVQRARD